MKTALWISQAVNFFFVIVSIVELAAGNHGRFPVLAWLISLLIYWTFLLLSYFFIVVVVKRRQPLYTPVTEQHHHHHKKPKPPKDWSSDYQSFFGASMLYWIGPTILAVIYYANYKNDGSPHTLQTVDLLGVIRRDDKMMPWSMVVMGAWMFGSMLLVDGMKLMSRSDALVCQSKKKI